MRPIPLQNQFNAGMKRDSSRNRMPPNSVWNMEDMIVDYGAPARERGGWAYASNSISAVSSTASYVKGGIFAVFSPTAGEDPANLCIDEDGRMYEVAQAGTVTDIGATGTIYQNPVFHGGTAVSAATAVYTGLVIIPIGHSAVPKKYDGTTLSNLGGTPPAAKFATVYKDYPVLANVKVSSIIYPNRAIFGPPGDPDVGFSGAVTAWDTTDAFIDFSLPIIGAGATKNVLLATRSRPKALPGIAPDGKAILTSDDILDERDAGGVRHPASRSRPDPTRWTPRKRRGGRRRAHPLSARVQVARAAPHRRHGVDSPRPPHVTAGARSPSVGSVSAGNQPNTIPA